MSCASQNCLGIQEKTEVLNLVDQGGQPFTDPLPSNFLSLVGVSSNNKPPGGFDGKFILPDGDTAFVVLDTLNGVAKHIAILLSSKGLLESWDQIGNILLSSYRKRPGFKYSPLPAQKKVSLMPPAPVKRLLSPVQYGRSAWTMWHMSIHYFDKNPEFFSKYSEMLRFLLSVEQSEITGCANCSAHFEAFLKEHPIGGIMNKAQAALYTVAAHNEASIDSGRQPWTLGQAARFYRWDFLLEDDQFTPILTKTKYEF